MIPRSPHASAGSAFPRRTTLATLIATTALLAACVAGPIHESNYGETVYVAPPPPRVEYVGPPPVIGHVWIAGFWQWGGARYVWVPGRWEAPRAGYHWEPHRWERDGDRWRSHGGRWVPEASRPDWRDERRGHDPRERGGRDGYDGHDRRDQRSSSQENTFGGRRIAIAEPQRAAPPAALAPVPPAVRNAAPVERNAVWREREAHQTGDGRPHDAVARIGDVRTPAAASPLQRAGDAPAGAPARAHERGDLARNERVGAGERHDQTRDERRQRPDRQGRDDRQSRRDDGTRPAQ